MTLDGAIYHTDWHNMQVLSFATSAASPGNPGLPTGAIPAFVNAPAAAVDGLELESTIELFKGLEARLSTPTSTRG
jgi:hypothetical protein